MTVSFIQRNVTKRSAGGSGTLTVPFHSSAAASDLQMLAISNATGVTPTSPSGSGWSLLFSRSNTYSSLFIYTRAIVSGDLSSNITFTAQDYTNAELRTYRVTDGEVFSVGSSGNGLVAGSITVATWLIRCWASAQINTSGGSTKTLTAPAGLLNSGSPTSYNWYDGGLFGDDPTTSGSAGTSTATHSAGAETNTPQWVNLLLQAPPSLASGISSADATGTTISAPSTGGAAGSSAAGITGAGVVVVLSSLAGSGGSDYQLSRRIAIAVALAEETDAPRAPGVYIPSGDRYGDARIISGSNGTLALSFTGAGTETGEPLPTGVTKTLWLLWETDEQSNPRVVFDTGVASIVIGNDDPAIAGFSSVWDGEGGVAAYPNALSFYKVQLGWRTGDPPDFTLTWESDDPPFYDEFSTPYEMAGDEDRANLSTEFCTLQPSEPVAVGTQTSAWSRWEPSSSGEAILETSDPALIIRVYEDSVDIISLTLVTSGTGSVTFTATDPAYLIQICDTTEPGA